MKKTVLLIMIVGILLVGCSEESLIINGQTITYSKSDYTELQLEALENLEAGTTDTRTLMVKGIFTKDELTTLGLDMNTPNGNVERNPEDNIADFIEQLDLNTLSEDQLALIDQLKAGEITLQDLYANELFKDLMPEDMATGSKGQGMNRDLSGLEDLDLSSYSEEQQAAVQQVIDGELSMRDLMETELFTQEEIRALMNK